MISGTRDHPENTAGADMPVPDVARLFPDSRARYSLSTLVGDPPQPARQVLQELWAGVWAGIVTNDTMIALRRGIARGFKTTGPSNDKMTAGHGSMARSRRNRHRDSGSLSEGSAGNWYLIVNPQPPEGLVAVEEIVKDRVRLLLDRYGILFRQILSRELRVFQWSAIFRSLRLMELSGEVVTGCFFNDIPGLQFVSNRMLRLLREKLPDDRLYWVSAQDPASICGLGIDAIKGELPRRAAGTHLVYIGSRLAMVSKRKGKVLRIHLPVDHARLADCFNLFDHLLGRRIDPLRSISVETINSKDAADSPYLEVLRDRFDTIVETRTVALYQRMGT
jgi:ATP-dependent Lhr-like helicase